MGLFIFVIGVSLLIYGYFYFDETEHNINLKKRLENIEILYGKKFSDNIRCQHFHNINTCNYALLDVLTTKDFFKLEEDLRDGLISDCVSLEDYSREGEQNNEQKRRYLISGSVIFVFSITFFTPLGYL
ncbi:hypothetical protein M9C84_06440 [SAR86 cluster bacterium]|jgi:hypothetical protein|nr:hypothetical protein M9C84_06440 [SAR86 cluster bacterium]